MIYTLTIDIAFAIGTMRVVARSWKLSHNSSFLICDFQI
jgi:hypothetical protein